MKRRKTPPPKPFTPTIYRFKCRCGHRFEATGRPLAPCPNCHTPCSSQDTFCPSPV